MQEDYLSPELSINRLYQNFLQCHDPEYLQLEQENQQRRMCHEPTQKVRKPLVSEHMYHDIFIGEFNIHFGYPKSDTCGTCDGLKIQLQQASSESERATLQKEHEAHLSLAEAGYDALRYDQQLSKKSWEVVCKNREHTKN